MSALLQPLYGWLPVEPGLSSWLLMPLCFWCGWMAAMGGYGRDRG